MPKWGNMSMLEYLSAISYKKRQLWVLYRTFLTSLYGRIPNFREDHFKNSQKLQFWSENIIPLGLDSWNKHTSMKNMYPSWNWPQDSQIGGLSDCTRMRPGDTQSPRSHRNKQNKQPHLMVRMDSPSTRPVWTMTALIAPLLQFLSVFSWPVYITFGSPWPTNSQTLSWVSIFLVFFDTCANFVFQNDWNKNHVSLCLGCMGLFFFCGIPYHSVLVHVYSGPPPFLKLRYVRTWC